MKSGGSVLSRLGWFTGILAAVASTTLTAPAAPATSAVGFDPDACAATSWVAGTVDLCHGTLVYRDYVYDDYGADLGPIASQTAETTGSLTRPAGDVRYKGPPSTADLVDLRLRLHGQRLIVTFELNALYQADSTVAALAIDTDTNESTGGGRWGSLPVRSDGWDELHLFERGDPEKNIIRGAVPLPRGTRWRLQAVTAQAGGPVMNVAFRGPNERADADLATMNAGKVGVWFEDQQAAALANRDISRFGYTVNLGKLRSGVTQRAVVGPGLHERVYASDYTLPPGEGMSYQGVPGRGTGGTAESFPQVFNYLGRYQPYGIYIPKSPGPHGLQFIYHGSQANHASLINQPGMQQDIGESLNRILVVPLARGPDGYGSDISERDILDVHADVLANYNIDHDRVFAGGYSQGGYIAYRMAALYPHLFAGFINWVGFTGDAGNLPGPVLVKGVATGGAVGNMTDFVGNLRHIPGVMLYAGADEFVHATSAEAMAQQFRTRDFPYRFYMHPTAEHLTFALLDDWSKEADYTADLKRTHRPARVVYRTASFLGNVDYDLRHDRAYWLRDIRSRGPGYADLDVTSAGCGGSVPVVESGFETADKPVPWVSDFHQVVAYHEIPRGSAFKADLRNVSSVRVDVAGACLADSPITYRINTDGAVTVRFSDGRILELSHAGTHTGQV